MSDLASDLYLDLLSKVLTRHGFEDTGPRVPVPVESYLSYVMRLAEKECAKKDLLLFEPLDFDPALRDEGKDWPATADTMIGLRRLANLRECTETVIRDGIAGDLIETGVWRGGAAILMRAVLKAHGITDRTVWVADSFQGLPPPDPRYPADDGDQHHTFDALAISEAEVRERFARYDLLDECVRFLPGWFEETLADAPISELAVLRLDGDMYSSTIVALDALYDKVGPGGFVIIDDYGAIPSCAKAVEDYRADHGIREPMETVDWTGVYWRKT